MVPVRDTFLFVSDRAAFGEGLIASLRSAGKVVLEKRGIAEALDLLQRWRADSILVDDHLGGHTLMPELRATAKNTGADLWVMAIDSPSRVASDAG